MDPTTVLSLTGKFVTLVGEVASGLKRQDLTAVDGDWLKLKRQQLSEKLEEYKSDLHAAVKREKAKAQQDHVSRGLGNNIMLQSAFQAIKQDAATQLGRASREYNRAIEEIGLIERKLEIRKREGWWKKLLRRFLPIPTKKR
jgi:hypothetical protein